MAFVEIPVVAARQQTMTIPLGAQSYRLRLGFSTADEGGWFLDIADVSGSPLVCGIALVTGVDVLAPYRYVGIPGRLWVMTDIDPDAVPTFEGLGVSSHLLFEPF